MLLLQDGEEDVLLVFVLQVITEERAQLFPPGRQRFDVPVPLWRDDAFVQERFEKGFHERHFLNQLPAESLHKVLF